MRPCPNCNQPLPVSATICPHCGYIMAAHPENRLITGMPFVDGFLGFIVALISPFLFGVGVLAAIVLCATLIRTYGAFARGLLYGLIVWGVLALGGLILCFGFLASAKY